MAALLYLLVSTIGFSLTVYSLLIEHKKLSDETYSAYCDISEDISCSAVLTSEYSIGFGLIEGMLGKDHFLNQPNAYYGAIFYPLQILLSFLLSNREMVILSLLINTIVSIVSCYLIYILFFVIRKVCIVCIGVHAVNFILLLCSYAMLSGASKKRKKD